MLDGTVTTYIKLVNYNTQRDDFLQTNLNSVMSLREKKIFSLITSLQNNQFILMGTNNHTIYYITSSRWCLVSTSICFLNGHTAPRQAANHTRVERMYLSNTTAYDTADLTMVILCLLDRASL